MLTQGARKTLFIIAGGLVALAIVWSLVLYNTGDSNRICDYINRFGYSLVPDDLYAAGSWRDTSIRELLAGEDLAQVINASIRAGFTSDADKTGDITLIMANPSGNDAIMIFLVGSEIELAFVQTAGEGLIGALGE